MWKRILPSDSCIFVMPEMDNYIQFTKEIGVYKRDNIIHLSTDICDEGVQRERKRAAARGMHSVCKCSKSRAEDELSK